MLFHLQYGRFHIYLCCMVAPDKFKIKKKKKEMENVCLPVPAAPRTARNPKPSRWREREAQLATLAVKQLRPLQSKPEREELRGIRPRAACFKQRPRIARRVFGARRGEQHWGKPVSCDGQHSPKRPRLERAHFPRSARSAAQRGSQRDV